MTDREKYLFDLQGFVVVKGVLDRDHLDRLNAAMDANMDKRTEMESKTGGQSALRGTHKRVTVRGMLEWEHPSCDPFRELIVPIKLIPHLDTLLGRGWCSDLVEYHYAVPDTEGLHLHLGTPHFSHAFHYIYGNGQMRNGLIVVQYLLSDVPPGAGGFCCIPGSHKANFMRPDDADIWEVDRSIVVSPSGEAGDAIIFTEALTHGTLPWRAEHDRRALLWRYWPLMLGNGFMQPVLPDWLEELTEAQRTAMTPSRAVLFGNRGLIARDGSVVYVDADYDEPPMRYAVNRSHLYEGPPDWIIPPDRPKPKE